MPSPQLLSRLASLDGRTAVVTGGGKGIGAAIAARLAEAGAAVLIGDLAEGTAAQVAEEISAAGWTAAGAALDVSNAESVDRLAAAAVDRYGRLDIWVNNAGIFPRGSILEIEPDDWDRVMAINVRGPYLGARAAARRMIEQGNGGVIVNITSDAAFNASEGSNGAHYVASKHALAGLTKSIAVQLAPHRIRALAVAPTLTHTAAVEADRRSGHAAGIDAFAAKIPAGRIGDPDDVARVVAFAASEQSSFVSGSTIVVDGGNLAR